ncbi:hypothetical protein Pcinc_022139 [Petrolisthes cinctipes]|uniref:Uncharacterized protein n=1 Tax=Petrolisthes cinctipes TaxID=88211 RepID=A0AAE1FG11_PETCI|nr:hypothetical protein Pcinc_022139 [Petrolisthes cinctipes]
MCFLLTLAPPTILFHPSSSPFTSCIHRSSSLCSHSCCPTYSSISPPSYVLTLAVPTYSSIPPNPLPLTLAVPTYYFISPPSYALTLAALLTPPSLLLLLFPSL